MIRDRFRRSPRRAIFRASLEALESREVLTAMLGLTAAGQLANFDSARPDLVRSLTPITGLQVGETVMGIDARPATGQIYGLGSTGRLYTLDPSSGAASLVGTGPLAASLSGTEFSLDFNPVADRLRIVSDNGLDLRVNPDTAEVTVDGTLSYVSTDSGAGTTPSIVGASYTNSVAGATSTTLFAIDGKRHTLVTQGSIGGVPISPNTGQLFSVASLSTTASAPLGLDILPDGSAFVSQAVAGGGTALYTLSTTTGALDLVGAFPSAVAIRDITTLPRVETLYAVTTGNRLISFRATSPGTLLSNQGILGLQVGETIRSLDFRPATGQLFGFGSTGRFYILNPASGAATVVSAAPISPAATGTKPSIDFNPTVDRIRLVTNAGQDLRVNPDTGAVVATDGTLAYSGTDPAAGVLPSIVAQGYTNSVFGATATSLYAIDSARDTLVLQGSPGGSPISPNTGQLFTVGALGRDVSANAGLDVAANGIAYAALTDEGSGSSILYVVNLANGALTPLGTIGGGAVIADVALATAGVAQFSATTYTVDQGTGSATIVVNRVGGDSGAVRVSYATSDGTATAGLDYTATSGVLNFADGETVKTFTVPIRSNSFNNGSRTVNLSLSSPTDGLVLGAVGTTVLTIQAAGSVLTPGIVTAIFRGPAGSIRALAITFNGVVDPSQASSPDNYRVRGYSAIRPSRFVDLPIASVAYDSLSNTGVLYFANTFALKYYGVIQVVAKGFGTNGFDAVATYRVLRGPVIRYTDDDGDRVILRFRGRQSRLLVMRRLDQTATYVFVDGPGRGRIVTGSLQRGRGTDRVTIIDRFLTNGAKVRVPRSILIESLVNFD